MKSQKAILDLFKKDPFKDLSTSEIVENIETEEIRDIDNILNNDYIDNDKIRLAKRKKAQLHRKILYHLNEYVNQGILKVSKEGVKGEKYFALDIEEGEEMVIDDHIRKKSITISKPQTPTIPIEGYEQKGIVHRLEPSTWIERLNSIIIECGMFNSLKELLHFISTCFSNINDTIALNDFEYLFKKYEVNQIISFTNQLNIRCHDYGKRLSCIFDVTNIDKSTPIISFLEGYQKLKDKNIYFIFDIKVREFQDHSLFFEKLIEIFSKSNSYLYIKNQDLYQAPYILGRAGPYAFDETEWKMYKKELQRNLKSMVCAHSTIMVDAERFFNEESMEIDDFKNLNLKIAESLLNANSIQRKRSDEFFSNIIKLNEPNINDIFIYSKNYVRFWNYGFKRNDIDQDDLINLFKKTKRAVDKYCIYEETIYKSCGMPTRFRIAFSIAFDDFVQNIFSKPMYKPFIITGLKDFYNEENKKILERKEAFFKIFDGGDLITFYRKGNYDSKDIIREISFILNTYKIPFFRFNFGNPIESNMSLSKFMEQ
ncbi:MAG: hypothetical protein ABII01_07695 [Candidatus Woesearchaeota archaeon]